MPWALYSTLFEIISRVYSFELNEGFVAVNYVFARCGAQLFPKLVSDLISAEHNQRNFVYAQPLLLLYNLAAGKNYHFYGLKRECVGIDRQLFVEYAARKHL